MNSILKGLILASLSLVGTHALAKSPIKKETPNCEVKSKKKHVKDQAACDKEQGKWLVVAPVSALGSSSASSSVSPANTGSASGSGSTAVDVQK